MEREFKDKLKGIAIVPVGVAIILVPFSMLIGWNLWTLFLFWFVLTPGLAIYLPTFVSRNKEHLPETVVGLIIFYGIMVFMIYGQSATDYFQVMIWSWVINLILISVISWARKSRVQTQ